MRWRVPSPLPAVPAVECPSRMLARRFGMPRPLSSATTSTPRRSPASRLRATMLPRVACFTMFVAASVTAMASAPAVVPSNPSGAASAATRRRASAMPLVSSTGITICSELPRVTGSFPARDRHARPAPRPRIDGKFIAQALGAPQPQAEPAAGRKAVLQRELDVCDARALVDERQAQAPARALGERLDLDLAAAAVDHGVARELARGRDDLGLVHQAEPDGLRLLAQELPCPHDVLRRAHRELDAAGGGALRGPSRDHRDV